MAKLTHRVLYSDLGCPLNLRDMAETKIDIEYHSLSFERLLWRHRKIGCTCMIYSTGKNYLSRRERTNETICQASGKNGISGKDEENQNAYYECCIYFTRKSRLLQNSTMDARFLRTGNLSCCGLYKRGDTLYHL